MREYKYIQNTKKKRKENEKAGPGSTPKRHLEHRQASNLNESCVRSKLSIDAHVPPQKLLVTGTPRHDASHMRLE